MESNFKTLRYKKTLDQFYKRLDTVLILKDDKAYNKLLKELRNVLIGTYDDVKSKSIKSVIDYLVKLDRDLFDSDDIVKIDELLQSKFGKDLPALVKDSVNELTEKIFKVGKKEVLSSVGFKFSFDVPDKEAVNFLKYFNNFWIENHYEDHTRSRMTEILNGYFKANSTLEDVANNFSKDFSNLTDKGISYFKNLAHITTNRTRSIGQINGLEKAKITEYELFNPDPESAICQQMNGTVFPVQRALDWRDEFLSLSDPSDIKERFAWVSEGQLRDYFNDSGDLSVNEADLPDGIIIPPLHGGPCKTTIRARL